MTVFEAASLTLQLAAVWVAALVGAAQCIVAGHGLFLLHRYYKRSAEQHRKNMKAIADRRRENTARHRENMAAINTQREAQKEQHQETMAAHQETMKALEGQNKALENQHEAMMELIRRTSGTPAQEDG